ERHGDGALGQRGRNTLGDVQAGCARGVVPTRAVGEGQCDHDAAPFAHSLPTNAGKRDLPVDTAISSAEATCLGRTFVGLSPTKTPTDSTVFRSSRASARNARAPTIGRAPAILRARSRAPTSPRAGSAEHA